MRRWSAYLPVLLIAVLGACAQPQDQTNNPAAQVPTSPNAAVQTGVPPVSPEQTSAAVTQPANEEITVSPETITVEPVITETGSPNTATTETPVGGGSGQATSGTSVAGGSGQATSGTSTGEFNCGDKSKLGQTLHIFSWADYWPEEDDNNLLRDFQEACGVEVTIDTYPSNEDLAAKIRAGNSGYDIIVPSDYMVDILIQEGRLLKLDKTQIPNIANLDQNQMGLYYDPNNDYSLPYQYGMTGIAFNSKEVSPAPDSWAALFDAERLKSYGNKVSMLDDERESVGAALKYQGHSYNSTNPEELAQAKALLLAQKPLLARYDSENVSSGLTSGEVVMAHAWNGAASLARSESADIEWIVPKEGGVIWQDSLAIPADAPEPYTAHVFINNVLDGKIGARITDFTYYLTPNKAAEALVSEEVREILFYPDDEMRKRLEYIERKGDPALYSDIWTEVKGQ
jgi:spermidine/putrescine transport system substrate-binding protein